MNDLVIAETLWKRWGLVVEINCTARLNKYTCHYAPYIVLSTIASHPSSVIKPIFRLNTWNLRSITLGNHRHDESGICQFNYTDITKFVCMWVVQLQNMDINKMWYLVTNKHSNKSIFHRCSQQDAEQQYVLWKCPGVNHNKTRAKMVLGQRL